MAEKTSPCVQTERCNLDRLVNGRLHRNGDAVIQVQYRTTKCVQSRNAGMNPTVEIDIHGGEKQRELFEQLHEAIRKIHRRQRMNGSGLEYRVRLLD